MERHGEFDAMEIFYFCGTGNSLFVAKEMAKKLPGAELTPIVSSLSKNEVSSNASTVVVVFPEHALTMPIAVKKFLEKIKLPDADFICIVVTRAGTVFSGFGRIERILRKKHKKASFMHVLNMYNNDSRHSNYAVPSTEELEKIRENVLCDIEYITENIAAKKSNHFVDIDVIHPIAGNRLAQWLVEHVVLIAMDIAECVGGVNYFYHDRKCTGCGICEKVCLSRKICMRDNAPVWDTKKMCYMCFACLNFCPAASVQIKTIPGVKSYTAENGRYTHPYASVADLEGQKR